MQIPLHFVLFFYTTAAAAALYSTQLAPRKNLFSLSPSCPHTHFPTLDQFHSAISTYCTNHFTPNRWLEPNEKVTYTYVLADGRGYPIKWIVQVMWERRGFMGGGRMLTVGEECMGWFEGFTDMENIDGGWCETSDGSVLVTGGKKNVFEGTVRGMGLLVETRQRKDDGVLPPPEGEEG